VKKEKLNSEIQNWRANNLAKAREAKALKIREIKNKEIDEKLDNLAVTIDEKVEHEVAEKVRKLVDEEDVAVKKLKTDFYKVFYEVGGVQGMVKWIKADKYNKKEFYKLFVSLLKTESQKTEAPSMRQGVVVNIISPEGKKEIIVEGAVENA
jgi:sulfur relay (sulfurtransferase) DsrC/TusE family protein